MGGVILIRKKEEMKKSVIKNCHEGSGELECTDVLCKGDSNLGIGFMDNDILEAGTVIGEHLHKTNEEVYYIISGEGTMIMDGVKYPISAGDVSLVSAGHTHGIINSDSGRMHIIVFAVNKE
jgi:mannose-6-phosphate isomerase-like protein (cupin superfamily)